MYDAGLEAELQAIEEARRRQEELIAANWENALHVAVSNILNFVPILEGRGVSPITFQVMRTRRVKKKWLDPGPRWSPGHYYVDSPYKGWCIIDANLGGSGGADTWVQDEAVLLSNQGHIFRGVAGHSDERLTIPEGASSTPLDTWDYARSVLANTYRMGVVAEAYIRGDDKPWKFNLDTGPPLA